MIPNKQHYDCFSSLIEHSSRATHVYVLLFSIVLSDNWRNCSDDKHS